MRGKSKVNKTWRLFHVDLFRKNTIEEGIINTNNIDEYFNYARP